MNSKACLTPTDSTSGDAGDDIAPGGNPVIATFTAPLKPFCPTTEITTGGLMVPTVMEVVEGFTDKLKSCRGGGGGGGGVEVTPPPPQPAARNAATDAEQASARNFLEMPNLLFPAFISILLV
jgi:hypothetical protein